MKFSRSKQVALRATWQPVESSAEEYEQAKEFLRAQYLADGRAYLDSNGVLSFIDYKAYEEFSDEADRIEQARRQTSIISQVRAIADAKLQECITRQDSQEVFDRLTYLASRRNSPRASWVSSYRKCCDAAESVLLQVAMSGFVDQLAESIQADPAGTLQWFFDPSSHTP